MHDSEVASHTVRLYCQELMRTQVKLDAADKDLETLRQMHEAMQDQGACGGASDCSRHMLAALHKLVELPMGTLSAGEMLVHLAKVIKTRRDDSAGVCAERAQASSCSGEHLTAELRAQIKQLEEDKDQVEGDQRDVINDLTKANGQLNVFVTKLRDRVRARDVELTCKSDELDAMRAQLTEKEAKSGERETSTGQETVASLTAQNEQLEKDIAALREEAHSWDANLCSKNALITILEKKCFEKEDAMIRAVKERDTARAKNNTFDKSQAKIARITTELVKYKASSERYKEEAEKSNELVKKYSNDGKFEAFWATLQGLPEPSCAPPINRTPCATHMCANVFSGVSELLSELYGAKAVLYLDDVPVWFPKRMHGIYAVPAYTYTNQGPTLSALWTLNTLRKDVCETVREVFYRTSHESIVYAGTYKITASSTFAMKKCDVARCKPLVHATKNLPLRTLLLPDKDEDVLDAIEGLYAEGLLSFGLLGLQCIGFTKDFDAPVRKWEAQRLGEGPTSPKVSTNSDSSVGTGLVAKRKSDGSTVDSRKRPRTVADATVEVNRADKNDKLPGILKHVVFPKERIPKKRPEANPPLRVKRTGGSCE